MKRRYVWLATLIVLAFGPGVGGASAQHYGDSYSAAPDYYDGGPFGGGQYEPYFQPPPGAPPPREGYDRRPPPPDYTYEEPDDRRDVRPRLPYADPLHDRDLDRRRRDLDQRGDVDQGDPNDPSGVAPPYSNDPSHKASDDDLGDGSRRTTRTEVANKTNQPPGTIVIDTASRHLYLTQANGQALEYGIGVGRQGFAWKGTAQVRRKSEWPDWIPPSDMLKRRPDLPTRMAGGIENPLGARALYLYQGNKDTLFRIHGTNEPDTIGKAVSSGCIRMMNADVIDLYSRVPVGTKVVVL